MPVTKSSLYKVYFLCPCLIIYKVNFDQGGQEYFQAKENMNVLLVLAQVVGNLKSFHSNPAEGKKGRYTPV